VFGIELFKHSLLIADHYNSTHSFIPGVLLGSIFWAKILPLFIGPGTDVMNFFNSPKKWAKTIGVFC
jgi:membrane-bound metal-dependent hydrolase YbcI (DUF457 family)